MRMSSLGEISAVIAQVQSSEEGATTRNNIIKSGKNKCEARSHSHLKYADISGHA
jgi:hypothetical protein